MPQLKSLLDNETKPMKPAEFAEHKILEAILDNTYSPGDALPAERVLAKSLGVTRPTLRETLQRLAKDGWVTIAHGKPTRVNDFLTQGGLGVLTTLARYGDYLSNDMILHLLKARVLILPAVAQEAAQNDPGVILSYLDAELAKDIDAVSFARFDRGLQTLMVTLAQNPVLAMIFNDFTPAYEVLGERYFSVDQARERSRAYYSQLKEALRDGAEIRSLVEDEMQAAVLLWEGVS